MNTLGKEFLQRLLITAVVLTVVTALVVFAFATGMFYLLLAVILALTILGVQEYIRMTHSFAKVNTPVLIVASLFVVVSFAFSSVQEKLLFLAPLSLLISVILLMIFHFHRIEGAIKDISAGFFGIVYIAVPLGMVLSILYFKQGVTSYDGRFWLAYLLSVTKVSDVSAYFIGKFFGKRKLLLKVSPNKTLEGAIAGFVASVLLSLFLQRLMPEQISTLVALILGIVLAVFSQVGDLSESLFKRDVQIKDSSSIPGIGGVLDLLDSIFINGAILYFFLLVKEVL